MAVDFAGDELPDSGAKVFMTNSDELGDAAQQLMETTVPSQSPLVAHAGDLVTCLGLIIVFMAEAIKNAFP